MLTFGEYAPDQAQVDATYSTIAKNVIAGFNSYHPVKSPVVVTDALPNTPQGADYFYTSDGARVSIVGDSVALYRLDGDSWTDIKSGAYTASIIDLWEYAQFGNLAIATNGIDAVQKYDVDAGGTFATLGGSPPKAKYVATVRDFVVLANTSSGGSASQNEVRWSSINNAESWAIGSNSADQQTLPDGGVIRGIVGGEVGYIFQDRAIRRMTFTSGRLIFRFEKIATDFGCLSSKSIVQHGDKIFFLGTDGFYMLTGDQTVPIGAQKVNNTFFDDLRADYIDNVHGVIDQKNQVVMWFYADKFSTAGSLIANKVFIYNWVTNKWSHAELESAGSVSSLSTAVSLDTGDIASLSLDSLTYSLDDPSLFGNDPNISIFKDDKKMYTLTGSPLEAIIETGDTQPSINGRSFISGCTVISQATGTLVSVETKESVTGVGVFSAEESAQDTGVTPLHASGRFLNIRVRIPFGQTWKDAQGIMPEFKQGGSR